MRYSDCNIDSRPLHCSIVRPSMDRPPSYSDACNAPPLYETPFNKVSMFEAPPVYPETSKLSQQVSNITNDQTNPITIHI